MNPPDLIALSERLEKRAEKERSCAENSAVVAFLLKPEYDKFDTRESPWNTYAVRMAVEHQLAAKKDGEFADDLFQASTFLRELASAIEAGTAETEGLGAKHESAVGEAGTPTP